MTVRERERKNKKMQVKIQEIIEVTVREKTTKKLVKIQEIIEVTVRKREKTRKKRVKIQEIIELMAVMFRLQSGS